MHRYYKKYCIGLGIDFFYIMNQKSRYKIGSLGKSEYLQRYGDLVQIKKNTLYLYNLNPFINYTGGILLSFFIPTKKMSKTLKQFIVKKNRSGTTYVIKGGMQKIDNDFISYKMPSLFIDLLLDHERFRLFYKKILTWPETEKEIRKRSRYNNLRDKRNLFKTKLMDI